MNTSPSWGKGPIDNFANGEFQLLLWLPISQLNREWTACRLWNLSSIEQSSNLRDAEVDSTAVGAWEARGVRGLWVNSNMEKRYGKFTSHAKHQTQKKKYNMRCLWDKIASTAIEGNISCGKCTKHAKNQNSKWKVLSQKKEVKITYVRAGLLKYNVAVKCEAYGTR